MIVLRLYDITAGPNDPNREALDMCQELGLIIFLQETAILGHSIKEKV
jgi:hypothetical protein